MQAPDELVIKKSDTIDDDEKIHQSQGIALPGGAHTQIEMSYGRLKKQEDRVGIADIPSETELSSSRIGGSLYNTVMRLGHQCMEEPSGTILVAASPNLLNETRLSA